MLFASSSRRLSQPILATALAIAICCGVCVSALAAGLTSAPRENAIVHAAAPKAADEAPASAAVELSPAPERETASAAPDCVHDDHSCPEGSTTLTSSEPMMSSHEACTIPDDKQRSGQASNTRSAATEPACSESELDCSASYAELK